ncbi:Rrp15p-domain-containing protein [Xylariaceae sp. FL0662B]|nr:Rrp15p-domain-containing protein [Xylariaceae sp. FL0662B]
MPGPNSKKRHHQAVSSRPKKKQKKVTTKYHSDSDEENGNPEFNPVNLLDSDDDDLNNIIVDDVAPDSDLNQGSASDSDSDSDEAPRLKTFPKLKETIAKKKSNKEPKSKSLDEGSKEDSDDNNDDDDDDDDEEEDEDSADSDGDHSITAPSHTSKSKRNDPDAFATSISKILSTKLSTTRRADPVLARSAEAHRAAKDVVDNALEAKARKHLREEKRAAAEKGRVKDVLMGATDEVTGEPESSTAEIRQTEKRLRKVAHRGVIMLFRAVREAQERAAEADKEARKEGVVGVTRREEKVNEMSRQGFLDLIAGGGGKLKKGALEEA